MMNQDLNTLDVNEQKVERSSKSLLTQRVALLIQYLGKNYHGWQRQPNYSTIQGEIERAIAKVVNYPVTVFGAGRTDAGVHSSAQVAHFDVVSSIPAQRWAKVLNHHLPEDILIRASIGVSYPWHSQFSASSRRYRYTIYTDPCPNIFIKDVSWHYYYAPLDESLMKSALIPLVGRHHLSAFHRANSSRDHSWVEVQEVECYRNGAFVYLEIQANGFLYGMVRLLVGMLIEVGIGKRSLLSFSDIWQNERREMVKYSAPAKGLCLLRVGYEDHPFPEKLWSDSQPILTINSYQ
jgi:tRNA pseudouridine38-40 synthase